MAPYILFMIVLVVAYFITLPLAVIWSLNTLFVLGIDYSFTTWLAALVIVSVFTVKVNKS